MIDRVGVDVFYEDLNIGDIVLCLGQFPAVGVVSRVIDTETVVMATPVKIGHNERYCGSRLIMKINMELVKKWFNRQPIDELMALNDIDAGRIERLSKYISERGMEAK